jgi:two-component system probable response regulator PhcQ
MTDAPAYAVLFVDDETKAQRYFLEAFQDDFPVYCASNASEAYSLLEARGKEIGVIVTDQRMPGESGVDLLEKARHLNPNVVRILVTAYTDYQTAVDAVNEGRVFRYLHKPWDPEELHSTLKRALDHYTALVERERLLRLKVESIRQMQMADKVAGMGILAEGLNHHLRNALTAVRAFIDLAPAKLGDELEGKAPVDEVFWSEYQAHAQNQLDRIYGLLSNVGQASVGKQFQKDEDVSVANVISSVFSMFDQMFTEKRVAVFLDIDPSTPSLRVNSEKFRQLWKLVFTEGVTHLSAGDEMVITVAPAVDSNERRCVRISISDNGEWPADERHANLFDPFFVRSRKPDDLGVRMMACYIIVHSHGGTIEARPGSLNGVDITMDFPLDDTPAPEMSDFFTKLMDHERRWREREVEFLI